MLAGRDENGGSFIVLASDGGGGGPRSRWQADGGSLWRHWTVTVDYSGIRWWIMIVGAADHRLIAAGLPDIWCSSSDTRPLLTIIRQFTDIQLFFQNVHPYQCC